MLDRTKVLHGLRHSKSLSARRNQGLAWSSDSNLWRNQTLQEPKCQTELRSCMVLGLKPTGNQQLQERPKSQVEWRSRVVLSPQALWRLTHGGAFMSVQTRYSHASVLGPETKNELKLRISLEKRERTLGPSDPFGQFILDYTFSGSHPIRNTERATVIPVSLIQLTYLKLTPISFDKFKVITLY